VILTEYTCGKCGKQFTTNCLESDIRCPECRASLCEHCGEWTGGLD
jgi:DNA-directed RNA polymerase subunit RPC12/RpoP